VQLELQHISKHYGGVQALTDVSLTLAAGRIHALVGENGAGKSTLGKIIGGAVRPDSGTVLLDGDPVTVRTPREALASGIALVHQEIALAPALSVLDNMFLGAEATTAAFVKLRPQRRAFRELMAQTGFDLDPDARAASLRVGDQQKVEIARAIVRNARLLVLDEPTAALTAHESERLLDFLRAMRDRGITFVYVSHNLSEVLGLADSVTVLKDGRRVSTAESSACSIDSLVTQMLGRPLAAMFPPRRPAGGRRAVAMRVDGLTRAGVFENVTFEIHAGEVVGMAGLVGSGRSEIARSIFGADPVHGGSLELNGKRVRVRSPRDAVRHGIALVPESRKDQGLIAVGSVAANLTLPALASFASYGWISRRREHEIAHRVVRDVDVRTRGVGVPVATLSGGNQQKVVIGKWLVKRPVILIADEPTRGVDVGARYTIYELIQGLAADGLGVLLISSELEEVMGLSDRILVIHRGRVAAELSGHATKDEILRLAFTGTSSDKASGAPGVS
jgi:ABC-type sugar transport system ATPase subunit